MFSTIFQFTGSILLSYLVISRRKKDIIGLIVTTAYISNVKPSNSFRVIYETWLSKIGFIYLAIGYFIQLITADEQINNFLYSLPINKLLNINKISASVINIIYLLILGFFIATTMTRRYLNKLQIKDFDEFAPEGAIRLEVEK